MEKHRNPHVTASYPRIMHETMTSSSTPRVKKMYPMEPTHIPTSSHPSTNNPSTSNDEVQQGIEILMDDGYAELDARVFNLKYPQE